MAANRARDQRLGRQVAVKVLPKRLAEDPKALARFDREARAVAALSHLAHPPGAERRENLVGAEDGSGGQGQGASWIWLFGPPEILNQFGTSRLYMIHNIGNGARKEDVHHAFVILGHYRW